MGARRDEVLSYLADAQAYWGRYHDHKETSAWAALVLLTLLLGPVSRLSEFPIHGSLAGRVLGTGIALTLGVVTGAYVRQQFALRRRASALNQACFFLRSRYVGHPEDEIPESDFQPADLPGPYPESNKTAPSILILTADRMEALTPGPRGRLERAVYALIVVIVVICVGVLWIE